MEPQSVLIVDDDGDAVCSLSRALKTAYAHPRYCGATTVQKALELFVSESPHAVVLDLHLGRHEGVEDGFGLLREMLLRDPSVRVIVLTGHTSIEYGIRALKLGAANFIEKPAHIQHLAALLQDGIKQSEIRRCYERNVREGVESLDKVLSGRSAAMQKVRDEVVCAGQTQQPVLIVGETGTGKGLCALAIHRFGKRKEKRIVRYQPTFGTPDLVNSDLFGHARGAFTGAQSERNGLIAEADGGTLFLDEIEALPLETQVSLLGVLQERSIRRVGTDREVAVDFRLLCATNSNPTVDIERGKLRRDFYHRVAHCVIRMPSLDERREDILDLAPLVLTRLRERESINVFRLEDQALLFLMDRAWPGNVRELEGVVEGAAYRACFARRDSILVQDMHTHPGPEARLSTALNFHQRVERFKCSLVEESLRQNEGNQVRAARAIGLDRSSFRRIFQRAGHAQ